MPLTLVRTGSLIQDRQLAKIKLTVGPKIIPCAEEKRDLIEKVQSCCT